MWIKSKFRSLWALYFLAVFSFLIYGIVAFKFIQNLIENFDESNLIIFLLILPIPILVGWIFNHLYLFEISPTSKKIIVKNLIKTRNSEHFFSDFKEKFLTLEKTKQGDTFWAHLVMKNGKVISFPQSYYANFLQLYQAVDVIETHPKLSFNQKLKLYLLKKYKV